MRKAADRFLLLHHPHPAEAALADLLQQLVATDHRPGFSRPEVGLSRFDRRAEKIPGLLGSTQKGFHFLVQRWIAGANAVQVRRALGWVSQRQRMAENR